MQYAPSSGSTFICFLLFAFYTALDGYAYHYTLNLDEEKLDLKTDVAYAETQRALLFTITAILGVSAVLYVLHKCVDSYCLLVLRLIANFCAMAIFFGYKCGVLDEDGNIDTDGVKDYSFSNASDWGSTVAFAAAWVVISTFEIYELGYTVCMHWIVKIQVFLFWALLATCFCISGEKLLDDVDMDGTESEDIYAKLLLGVAGSSALAALLFLLYFMCELGEFVRLHMLVGGLTGTLLLATFCYQTYQFRDMMKEWKESEECQSPLIDCGDLYDYAMMLHNIHFAEMVCICLAIMATVGFDFVFLAPVVHGPNPSSKQGITIQIA